MNIYLILFAILASDFAMAQTISGIKSNLREEGGPVVRKSVKKSGKKGGENRWKGIVVGGKPESSSLEVVSCNDTSVEIKGPRSAFVSKGMIFVALGDGSSKGCDNCSPLFRQVKSIIPTSKGTKILTTNLATVDMLFESYIIDPHLLKLEPLESRLGCDCIANNVSKCDEVTKSGNYAKTTQPFVIDLRRSSGTFLLTYDMYGVADALYIVYEGARIFDTNGEVKGPHKTNVKYSGKSTTITVFIDAFTPGTEWEFLVGCAKPN